MFCYGVQRVVTASSGVATQVVVFQLGTSVMDPTTVEIGLTNRTAVSGAPICNLKQEAQLLQRDRSTLHVIQYFAKSLNITQDHSYDTVE